METLTNTVHDKTGLHYPLQQQITSGTQVGILVYKFNQIQPIGMQVQYCSSDLDW